MFQICIQELLFTAFVEVFVVDVPEARIIVVLMNEWSVCHSTILYIMFGRISLTVHVYVLLQCKRVLIYFKYNGCVQYCTVTLWYICFMFYLHVFDFTRLFQGTV
jgi:hypothetical protein